MANNHPGDTPSDDFLEQILGFQGYATGADANLVGNDTPAAAAMMLQLGSSDGTSHLGGQLGAALGGGGAYDGGATGFPLGLSLEQGKSGFLDASGSGRRFLREDIFDPRGASAVKPGFHGQPTSNTVPTAPQPPPVRPRVRARRGQATDPHSIAERLRRERIAERISALQDLVPSVNKTDRAAMLDEIVDYVKFLRLQVKVLSMSRLGGAGAVAPLVTDIPISSVELNHNSHTQMSSLRLEPMTFWSQEWCSTTAPRDEDNGWVLVSKEEGGEDGRTQPAWEKWSNDGTERQVAKLMEENVGAAMQFLQSKALCLMPISLASAIYHAQPPDNVHLVKPESNPPS